MKKILLIFSVIALFSSFAFADAIKVYYQDGSTEVIELRKPAARAELLSYSNNMQNYINLNSSSYRAGDTISIDFSVTGQLKNDAWIGLIPSNVPAGSEAENDRYDKTYKYLKGMKAGQIQLVIPRNTASGSYVIRIFTSDNSGRQVAESTYFQIY